MTLFSYASFFRSQDHAKRSPPKPPHLPSSRGRFFRKTNSDFSKSYSPFGTLISSDPAQIITSIFGSVSPLFGFLEGDLLFLGVKVCFFWSITFAWKNFLRDFLACCECLASQLFFETRVRSIQRLPPLQFLYKVLVCLHFFKWKSRRIFLSHPKRYLFGSGSLSPQRFLFASRFWPESSIPVSSSKSSPFS